MERGLDLRRLHVFLQSSLLLLLLCPARFTITAGSSTDQPCNVQPIHKCLINTYDMENNPTSTSAPPIVTCPEYEDGDQEFYLASGDSCCPENEVTAEVNLKPGMRTKIECSLVASDPDAITNPVIYEWKMQAPEGYRILLTVVTHDVYNTFTATDEEGDSEFTFSTRSFFEVGDSFLSSSNVVHMEASLESLDSTSQLFTVIGQVVNILNTFDITDDPQGCSDNGRNLWDTHTGCSDDSHRFEGSCYYFYSEGINLKQARRMCEKRTNGSHLVFIDNKEEQDFLASTSDDINQGSKDCSDDHDCDYWVGIERNNDGELTWMDGSQMIYEHFKKFDDDDQCFRLKSEDDYVWESHDCQHNHYGYICEKEYDCEQNSTTLTVYEYGESCYYFQTNKPMGSNIDEATKACEGMEGFHLVYIDDAEEQNFLASTSKNINPNKNDCSNDHDCDYWIGLKRNTEDQLVWMDDSSITYKNFKAFDVDDECFRLKSEDDYAWESHDCTHDHYGYICERELGYHGTQMSKGCITFGAQPAFTHTGRNYAFLLMFTYYIKTFEGHHGHGSMRTATLWTGNLIILCKSSDVETVSQTQTSLQINVSCSASSDSLKVNFQATGPGLVKINDIKFFVSGTTNPITPEPTSTPLPTTERQRTTGATTSTSTSPSKWSTELTSTSLRPSTNPMASLDRSSISTTPHPSTSHISTTEFSGISRPSSGGNGVIISVVVVLLIVLIIAFIGFLWYKKRRNSRDHQHPKGSNGILQNPAFENDIGEQHEYAEFTDASNRNSTSDAMQHYYSDLPCSASVSTNPAIYNEVGEQDYNTLFGGKERDDYHEYSQPDSTQRNSNAKDTPKESSYQELFEDGKRHPVAGANKLQRSLGMEQAVATSQSKVGERNSTGDHAYQDLRKDDVGYTSLQKSPEIGQKPATGDTDQELENSYQALHADSPEYFTLEPDETNTSPSQENLQNSTYQPLTQEPQYHDAGPEKGNTPTRKDATYQPLLTDVSNHVGSDSVSVNASKQGKNNPSDHPQQRLTASSSDGYASLVSTAEEEDEHEYESPKGRPTTSDYEDPINDEPYNHLQRRANQGPSSYQPQTRQTEDDYETPVNNYDSTSDTYQTLGNSQETSDGANEEYSHLHRHFGARPGDPPRISDNTNQYGTLDLGKNTGK